MEKLIFLQIRESEKKADELIENAKKEHEKRINEAKKNALSMMIKKTEEIQKEKEKELNEIKERLASETKNALETGKRKLEDGKRKYSKNIDKAVEFIIKKFEGQI